MKRLTHDVWPKVGTAKVTRCDVQYKGTKKKLTVYLKVFQMVYATKALNNRTARPLGTKF